MLIILFEEIYCIRENSEKKKKNKNEVFDYYFNNYIKKGFWCEVGVFFLLWRGICLVYIWEYRMGLFE